MRLASVWSMVFLIVIGISFFAKAGDMFSRDWLGKCLAQGTLIPVPSCSQPRRGCTAIGASL